MKNIYKILSILVFLITSVSCVDENITKVVPNGFVLFKNTTVAQPPVMTSATATNIFSKYEWTAVDNGTPSVSTYKLYIADADADPNFLNQIEYKGLSGINQNTRTATLTVKEFNELTNQLPTFKCTEMNINVRIQSTLGTSESTSYKQYSSPVKIAVTSYSIKPKQLSIISSTDISNAANGAILKSSSVANNDNYLAYAYLVAGTYNFVRPDACGGFTGATIFGGTGTLAAGAISTTATNTISVANTGHYLIKVNLDTNTYSLTQYTAIGAFGKATRGGTFFAGSAPTVPFNYDVNNKEWSATMDLLTGQKLKFKALKYTGPLTVAAASAPAPKPDFVPVAGSITYTTFGKGAAENILIDAGTDILVPGTLSNTDTQKYLVTVNVSNSGAYTYKLTLIP